MKNLSLIINGILAVAIAVLYVLHFQGETPIPATEVNTTSIETNSTIQEKEEIEEETYKPDFSVALNPSSNLPIAYVNLDSLNVSYKYIEDLNKKFDQKKYKALRKYEAEEIELREAAQSFQENIQSGVYKSEAEAAQRQQQLQEQAYNIETRKAKDAEKLQREQSELIGKINNNVAAYLKKYSKEFNYSYILASGSFSNILYANDSLDITKEVLKGLNSEYSKSK